jgi:HSP20 family protein
MIRTMVPWRERFPLAISRLENEMSDLMERMFGQEGEANGWSLGDFTPAVNLAEQENVFEISVELPGMKPEDVNVELKEGNLWISGKKTEEAEQEGKTYHRMERRHGEFRRVVPLPGAVDPEHVDANFRDGLLTIHIPKTEQSKSRRIEIAK